MIKEDIQQVSKVSFLFMLPESLLNEVRKGKKHEYEKRVWRFQAFKIGDATGLL
jgi:hypothetical protein